ncbi:MAG: hypothetical protein JWP81_4759 [Ferruginibacter sp.]|nr:hypothetical protein [Ferruginibacter sp.]
MYTFSVKENGPGIDIIITRAMLALAALVALIYRSNESFYASLAASLALFIIAGSIKILTVKFRINKLVVLFFSALILFAATHSFSFAFILLFNGYLVKFLNRKPGVEFTEEGISIIKLFGGPVYPWHEFSNIILKDGILTLDFKNNKLLQLDIEENTPNTNEQVFNDFCKTHIYATSAI